MFAMHARACNIAWNQAVSNKKAVKMTSTKLT